MTRSTLLTNVRIWDGEAVLTADSMRIRGASIAAIGEALASEAGERVIDCRGATAMPGLMDAHVHMELDPEQGTPPTLDQPRDPEAMAARAAAMARAGITTARDLGGGQWAELALRERIAAGAVAGPRLLCAGRPITSPGGHCHFWGGEAPDLETARDLVDRQVGAPAQGHERDQSPHAGARVLPSAGVDLIKVMATGGMFTRGSRPAAAQFDLPTLTGIVAAAASHGLPVAAHCHGTDGIELAARAGVRTIEHCSWMGDGGWAGNYDEHIAALIRAASIWVSPTVNRGWQRYLDAPDPAKLTRIRGAFQAMMRIGIPFVASTDAGIPGVHHHHLPEALAVFQRILQSRPAYVLRAATSEAARALGLDGITGRLAPGLAADVLLLDGDPLEDLTVLREPAAVWACGRCIVAPA